MSLYTPSDGSPLDPIRGRSQTLAGLLKREIPAEAHPFLSAVFRFCMESGGEREIGFRRVAGASFNPRPARMAAILIGDGAVRDPIVIGSAIHFCSEKPAEYRGARHQRVRAIVDTARTFFHHGVVEGRKVPNESALVAISATLEFARHLHQVDPTCGGKEQQEGEEMRQIVFARFTEILALANELTPGIGKLLKHWHERHDAT